MKIFKTEKTIDLNTLSQEQLISLLNLLNDRGEVNIKETDILIVKAEKAISRLDNFTRNDNANSIVKELKDIWVDIRKALSVLGLIIDSSMGAEIVDEFDNIINSISSKKETSYKERVIKSEL